MVASPGRAQPAFGVVVSADEFRPVLALAARMGVPLEPVPWPVEAGGTRPQWDGQRLAYLPSEPAAYLFHELVHWAIATDAERAVFDFGLGPAETFRGFHAGDERLIDRVDGRDLWIGQMLLPAEVCAQREGDSVTGFLLMSAFGCGPMDTSTWAEFGGDGDLDIDWHAASFDRVRAAMAEWSDLDADGWAALRTSVLAHVAEVLEFRTGLESVG